MSCAAMSCRKSETEVSLRHEPSSLSQRQIVGQPLRRLLRDEKSGRKKYFSFYPRNPLKSLDSDERIQGNPTLIIGGFAAKRRRSKKTKIGSIRLNGQPAAEKEPNRFHPTAKRSKPQNRAH